MESTLRLLLDKIYEFEGLVHLALKREESFEDFLRLISNKGLEISKISSGLWDANKSIEENDKPVSSDQTYFLEEYSIDEEPSNLISEISSENTNSLNSKNSEMIKEDKRGKLVFSINERFRFRRELFDNSDADFNNTLALVASMDSYEEAEDYFINEEGFDPNNQVVKEFMYVIKRYFR